jgi:hypothetical protein
MIAMRALRAPIFLVAIAAIAQVQITPLMDLDRDTGEASLSPDGETLIFDRCKVSGREADSLHWRISRRLPARALLGRNQ